MKIKVPGFLLVAANWVIIRKKIKMTSQMNAQPVGDAK
jgi:hypothetical protein